MDIDWMLSELRDELERLNESILALEDIGRRGGAATPRKSASKAGSSASSAAAKEEPAPRARQINRGK